MPNQVAVIGGPDARCGERVPAIMVPRRVARLQEPDVIAHCRRLITGYKCPRSFMLPDENGA